MLKDNTLFDLFWTICDARLNAPALKEMCRDLISASIELYRNVCRNLLPTASAPQYLFNVRNLFNVFKGILMSEEENITPETVVKLWMHENQRVFGDLLSEEKDRIWFLSTLKETSTYHFQKYVNVDSLELSINFVKVMQFASYYLIPL
jgi:hypothetical protein